MNNNWKRDKGYFWYFWFIDELPKWQCGQKHWWGFLNVDSGNALGVSVQGKDAIGVREILVWEWRHVSRKILTKLLSFWKGGWREPEDYKDLPGK